MHAMGLSLALVVAALAVALALQPWRALRADGVLQPWLACLVLLPWVWAAQRVMPGGVSVQLSGACLLVLMVGWPLAVLSLLPIAAIGAWLGGIAWPQALDHLAWNGMMAATLVLLFTGLDIVTAFTAVVACINNTGPGLGQVGPAGNFQGLSDLQTWVCSVVMLLGRLELLSVLVLFTPQFWRG